MQRTAKHVVARIHHFLKLGLLTINWKASEVKELFEDLAAKTGYFCGVGVTVVKKAVAEGNRMCGWADPLKRGGHPWENIDIAPHDQIASMRGAHHALSSGTKPVPTNDAKIARYLQENNVLDENGEKITLSKDKSIRILQICGYRFGAAGHHHVAKESKGNKAYRMKYLDRMLKGIETQTACPSSQKYITTKAM